MKNKPLMSDGCHVEANGDKSWWKDGKLHREDGPAVEWVNGHKSWWKAGELHREGGPAIERVDGNKSWWTDGVKIKSQVIQNLPMIAVHSCPGIDGTGCVDKQWIPKGTRHCEKCWKAYKPELIYKKRKFNSKKFVLKTEVNMPKLLEFLEKEKNDAKRKEIKKGIFKQYIM